VLITKMFKPLWGTHRPLIWTHWGGGGGGGKQTVVFGGGGGRGGG